MPDKIKCTVKDCKYNDNEFCKASAIQVDVTQGGVQAGSAKYTECRTFER